MDEAAKAARRMQIQSELTRTRSSRDENTVSRNRVNIDIEDLESASNQLSNCISKMRDIVRGVRDCHQEVPDSNFRGSRRTRIEDRLRQASDRLKSKRDAHMRNRELVIGRIRTLRDRRNELSRTVNIQNNRITSLEAELRRLR